MRLLVMLLAVSFLAAIVIVLSVTTKFMGH